MGFKFFFQWKDRRRLKIWAKYYNRLVLFRRISQLLRRGTKCITTNCVKKQQQIKNKSILSNDIHTGKERKENVGFCTERQELMRQLVVNVVDSSHGNIDPVISILTSIDWVSITLKYRYRSSIPCFIIAHSIVAGGTRANPSYPSAIRTDTN